MLCYALNPISTMLCDLVWISSAGILNNLLIFPEPNQSSLIARICKTNTRVVFCRRHSDAQVNIFLTNNILWISSLQLEKKNEWRIGGIYTLWKCYRYFHHWAFLGLSVNEFQQISPMFDRGNILHKSRKFGYDLI